jgi:hypothetical protein
MDDVLQEEQKRERTTALDLLAGSRADEHRARCFVPSIRDFSVSMGGSYSSCTHLTTLHPIISYFRIFFSLVSSSVGGTRRDVIEHNSQHPFDNPDETFANTEFFQMSQTNAVHSCSLREDGVAI